MAGELREWLAHGLKDARHARLDGAPVDPSAQARLARVFTDVAIEGGNDEARGRGALDILVHEAEAGLAVGRFLVGGDRRIGESARRYVVVGGPGQGKSTLVQQLAQVHRAHRLAPHRDALDTTAQRVLDDVLSQAKASGWGEPPVSRLPFLVPLGALSRWRATNRAGVGLLDFLVAGIGFADVTLSRDELAAVLQREPSLLLLDGLDEVPAAAGRRETLALVEEGLRALPDAPILVVGTTRPGAYQGDFGEARELRLARFDRDDALTYAGRLASEWFPDEVAAPHQLMERVRLAASDEQTARHLGTPHHATPRQPRRCAPPPLAGRAAGAVAALPRLLRRGLHAGARPASSPLPPARPEQEVRRRRTPPRRAAPPGARRDSGGH